MSVISWKCQCGEYFNKRQNTVDTEFFWYIKKQNSRKKKSKLKLWHQLYHVNYCLENII